MSNLTPEGIVYGSLTARDVDDVTNVLWTQTDRWIRASSYELQSAEIAALRRENAILKIKNSTSLANNLCSDHFDKQSGEKCLACKTAALNDMLSDSRKEQDMLREAFGLSIEPHQSLFERMLEAAKQVATLKQPVAEMENLRWALRRIAHMLDGRGKQVEMNLEQLRGIASVALLPTPATEPAAQPNDMHRDIQIAQARRIIAVFAAHNPKRTYSGVEQDPLGAHAWLERNKIGAETAAPVVTAVAPESIANAVVQNVCELPDYSSPDDQPDLVMCTVEQLKDCVLLAFQAATESAPVDTEEPKP